MSTNRKRLAIASGTTLALVLTGASIVSAQSSDQTALANDPGIGALHAPGRGGMGGGFGGRGGFGGGMGDLGRGEAILGHLENLVSHETVTLDADGNTLTARVQHGTVAAVADGSITIDLATGESVTIATDGNTTAYSWSTTDRPARTETALADIAAGADVMVWSQSQDDGSFLAERITVLPAAATTDDGSTTPEASPTAQG